MIIQIDSREKKHAIRRILAEFDKQGIRYYTSKLLVGDYQDLTHPMTIIDRKQNLNEVCQNVCQDHDRFRNELIKAQEAGIQLVILVEHGGKVHDIDDVLFWQNPRRKGSPKAMNGDTLFKIMKTMERKYGVKWEFCDKRVTGKRIIEILGGENGFQSD